MMQVHTRCICVEVCVCVCVVWVGGWGGMYATGCGWVCMQRGVCVGGWVGEYVTGCGVHSERTQTNNNRNNRDNTNKYTNHFKTTPPHNNTTTIHNIIIIYIINTSSYTSYIHHIYIISIHPIHNNIMAVSKGTINTQKVLSSINYHVYHDSSVSDTVLGHLHSAMMCALLYTGAYTTFSHVCCYINVCIAFT